MFIERRKGERRQGDRRRKPRNTPDRRRMERRRLLKLGAVATAGSLLYHPLVAKASQLLLPSREISLYNTHTGEQLSAEYYSAGHYSRAALAEINHILRDFRTGDIKPIDTDLLDLVHTITTQIRPGGRVHIISGYRSPKTNLALAQQGSGVASHSLHMDGKAMDIRIPGCDLKTLRQVAWSLQAGGVGYYEESDFVHVDTGRVRFW